MFSVKMAQDRDPRRVDLEAKSIENRANIFLFSYLFSVFYFLFTLYSLFSTRKLRKLSKLSKSSKLSQL